MRLRSSSMATTTPRLVVRSSEIRLCRAFGRETTATEASMRPWSQFASSARTTAPMRFAAP